MTTEHLMPGWGGWGWPTFGARVMVPGPSSQSLYFDKNNADSFRQVRKQPSHPAFSSTFSSQICAECFI